MKIKKNFFTGIIILLPLWITFFILWIFIKWTSNLARPVIILVCKYFNIDTPVTIRTLSFIFSIFIIYLVGLIANSNIGKRIISKLETVLIGLPIIKDIYLSSKQLVDFIVQYQRHKAKKVVMVEYPRKGVYVLGISTVEKDNEDKIGVFIPSTPNPTTGMLVFFDKQEVKYTNLSMEEAIKIIVSGGIVSSEDLSRFF